MSVATFALVPGCDLNAAVVAVTSGVLSKADLVQFCLVNPINLQHCPVLLGANVVDGNTFGQILAAQGAMIAAANKSSGGEITFKVSKKGAVSAYGLNNQYPVTLYAQQWERLVAEASVKKLTDYVASAPTNQFTLADYLFEGAKLAKKGEIQFAEEIGLGRHASHKPADSVAWCEIVNHAKINGYSEGLVARAKAQTVTVTVARK